MRLETAPTVWVTIEIPIDQPTEIGRAIVNIDRSSLTDEGISRNMYRRGEVSSPGAVGKPHLPCRLG